ncbi:hypothetical protein MMYC01_204639 [Madurella mycetomatis]|uniref:Protein kinase domain-containing protein n=1 Tax=Madurella mycetomatis TaxID=100816 RepID=A0A175W2L8_9PEZI|nr:hypothetical protein MMYC01_204639 [Madurella mycetomatis]
MIDEAFWALTSFGLEYSDIKLGNFHIVSAHGGSRIMVVNLEPVTDLDPRRLRSGPSSTRPTGSFSIGIRRWKVAAKAEAHYRTEIVTINDQSKADGRCGH